MIEKYVGFWNNLLMYNDRDSDSRGFAFKLLAAPIIGGAAATALLGFGTYYILPGALAVSLLAHLGAYVYLTLGASSRASKVEDVLPDFLSLVASNIRSGLTPDKALIVSAREEFGPLAIAVMIAGKNSITGMPLDEVMMGIGSRIRSETLDKTIRLIVEGLHSGGDMAELLEKTALDLRKFRSVRKEVNAMILNYVLFIVAAIAFGAPLLYGISTFLVDIMIKIKNKVGNTDMSSIGQVSIFKGKLAFTSDGISIFAGAAIFITILFGCMTVGVMSTGKKEDGLKYFPILAGIGLALLFGIRIGLSMVLGPLMEGG